MPTHQTVRLARGSHRSAADGVCAMELASMLAGERFSDRPRCVDPVIAAYLRAFNDRVGYSDRQRLYPYAARAVGTRTGRRRARARRDRCLAWAGVPLGGRGPLGRWLARLGARGRIALAIGIAPALALRVGAAEYAARTVIAARDVAGGLELLDALLREGRPAAPAPLPAAAPGGRPALATLS